MFQLYKPNPSLMWCNFRTLRLMLKQHCVWCWGNTASEAEESLQQGTTKILQPSRAQRDEADLKVDFDGLELKLNEVHFAVKFSEAEAQPRLRRTWLQSALSAVSTKCQRGDCQVHRAKHARRDVLGSFRVDIGEESVKIPSLHSAT